MMNRKWVTRTVKMILWLVPGTMLLGTSCGAELRASSIGALADFVGASLGELLEAWVPVDNLLPADGE